MATQDEFEATIQFKHDMILYAQNNWPGIASKLNGMFKLNPKLPDDIQSSFSFFLAILFVQSRAPYNIYSQEQGERIWKYLKNAFAAEPQFGAHANESLDLYDTVWNQYIEKEINPLGGIASALLYNLGYKEQEADAFSGMVLSDILAMSPPWWKNFSAKNELVKSDIPLNLGDFMLFAEDASIGSHTLTADPFHDLGNRLIESPEPRAVTDYKQARILEATMPNITNAWTHVVPALVKYAKCEGKRSLLGRDKGEMAYRELEEKLYLAVLGLYGDRLLLQGASIDECLTALLRSLVSFKEVYPNWTDAYSAAYRVLVAGRENIKPILTRHQRAVEAELY